VGVGVGKSRAVPDAIRKGTERARKNMKPVNLSGTTIPHEMVAEHGGAEVFLKPASPGTGVIAAGGVRAVLEAAGVRDILTKSLGSPNVLNVVQATLKGLHDMKDYQQEALNRGKPADDLRPFWMRKSNG
ncbi:MAG: 30S ribosomal protein S5, partial [Chloroflexota bacterium]